MKQNQVQEEFVTILQSFVSQQNELTNKFSQFLLKYKQQESLGIFSKISDELVQQMNMSSQQQQLQYQRYQTIDNHVRSHRFKFKYECEYCGKGYIHKLPMKKHLKKVHSDYKKASQLDIYDETKRKQFTARELMKKINLDDGFENDCQMITSNKLSEKEIRQKLLETLQVLDKQNEEENIIIYDSKEDLDQLEVILLDDIIDQ
ncbi:unnamed protein product [Paramecium sonneborni]|uniref:C2H2-type domain-containing protein n=1 Tax=Paramecium sonneborni TaxID=65129 RepID=A0A8S1JY52_9CILI|nr:unnamed protein product [Paramecium sonneborni]